MFYSSNKLFDYAILLNMFLTATIREKRNHKTLNKSKKSDYWLARHIQTHKLVLVLHTFNPENLVIYLLHYFTLPNIKVAIKHKVSILYCFIWWLWIPSILRNANKIAFPCNRLLIHHTKIANSIRVTNWCSAPIQTTQNWITLHSTHY